MKPFFAHNPEESKQEFLRNLKVRYLDQKFLYFGEGSNLYYKYVNAASNSDVKDWEVKSFVEGITANVEKKEKLAIFSIGCGSAIIDKDYMTILHEAGYDFTFIGIDSSEVMIQLAEETMKDVPFKTEFWVEDIVSPMFVKRVANTLKDFDRGVFAIIGGTIGNMVQTEIADTLYNVMFPGNLMIFECMIREANSKIGDLKLFNRYASRLKDENNINFVLHPLDMLGVPRNIGSLELENFLEESIGVLTFRFSFRFKEAYTVHFLDEYIHFIPPEKIKLIEVRVYHPDTMLNFFKWHNFTLLSRTEQHSEGTYVLQRK
ncbi:hypothetical protein COW46_01660 [Candidatus Gracilibacteria bacterium CG17_big_fil_post_rev_8_21_14_2_50_48_13]|nr:MAG: hypothetical protein COW46_01660 [Candidatus Gracilibacteria bacterium CG17_big_fil_post_rev_8_21_14_2_50_48_13]